VASSHRPLDEAPGRDVRAVIPEDFLLDSGERLAAAEVVGRLHGPDHGPLVGAAGGISGGRLAMCRWPWAVRPGGPVERAEVRALTFDLPSSRDDLASRSPPGIRPACVLPLDPFGEPRVQVFVSASSVS